MSDPVVYIDHSDIREGTLEDVRAGIGELVEFVESREPQLLGYGFYIDETASAMTVVALHPNSESLELHLEIGGPAFRKFTQLVDLRAIELYGRPSDKVLGQLQSKAEMLGANARIVIHQQDAGFMRFASSTS